MLMLCLVGGGAANALERPEGRVILTVRGDIATTNEDGQAAFDAAMLAALDGRTIETDTPWHDGAQTFRGPLARSVLEAVGADGETIIASALNDYSAEIPVSDLERYDVILATHLNGERMSVRERGPIFVIYPFDDNPDLHQETIYGRSVWQVNELTVE
jgi:hypothetical protein